MMIALQQQNYCVKDGSGPGLHFPASSLCFCYNACLRYAMLSSHLHMGWPPSHEQPSFSRTLSADAANKQYTCMGCSVDAAPDNWGLARKRTGMSKGSVTIAAVAQGNTGMGPKEVARAHMGGLGTPWGILSRALGAQLA